MFGWRKSCEELTKRMDPDLPYYYHTSTRNIAYFMSQNLMNQFTEKKQKNSNLLEENLLVATVGGRVTVVPHGSVSIRSQFHNASAANSGRSSDKRSNCPYVRAHAHLVGTFGGTQLVRTSV